MIVPGGRGFVHNDCPGGGRGFAPFESCPGGMVLDEIDSSIMTKGFHLTLTVSSSCQ